MDIPKDLIYTEEHEWVKVTNGNAIVGITDFAQGQLGDIIYLELPDAEGALNANGFIDREEFYLEHYTIFTRDSLSYLIENAGFKSHIIKRIYEPSDKYTLYSFLYS